MQADRITSNVSETTALGKRMSTVEQTASGLSVQLGNVSSAKYLASNYAQPLSTVKTWAAEGHVDNWTVASTSGVRVGDTAYVRMKVSDANVYVYVVVSVTTVTSATAIKGVSHGYVDQSGIDASIAAAAAQTTANTANGTANTAKTNAATAQSTANTARTEAANAAKTATNYLEYSSAGLDVGNKSSGKWSGFRTRMAASAFQVLDAAGTVLASYGANLVELGKNAKTAVIKLCGGAGEVTGVVGGTRDGLKISSGDLWLAGQTLTMQVVEAFVSGSLRIGNTLLTGDGYWLFGDGGAFGELCTNKSSAYPVYGAKILYDNGSGAVCPIGLNETSANFKYVEVYFGKLDGTQGGHKCVKVYAPNGKRFILDQANPVSSQDVLQLVSARMRFSGAQIVNEYNGYTANHYKGTASVGTTTEVSAIKIYRVVGYK